MLRLLNLHRRQRADAAGRDHAEQRDAGAAEHRLRDALDDGAHLRGETEQDQHATGEGRDVAAAHPGDRHQADVLREGGVGERVEHTAEHGGQTVRAQAVGEPALVDLARRRSAPMARMSPVVSVMITRPTMHIDTIADDLEDREAEVERRGDADPVRVRHLVPVHHARAEWRRWCRSRCPAGSRSGRAPAGRIARSAR